MRPHLSHERVVPNGPVPIAEPLVQPGSLERPRDLARQQLLDRVDPCVEQSQGFSVPASPREQASSGEALEIAPETQRVRHECEATQRFGGVVPGESEVGRGGRGGVAAKRASLRVGA